MQPPEADRDSPVVAEIAPRTEPVEAERPPNIPEIPKLHPTLRRAFDRSWERFESVYRRLGR